VELLGAAVVQPALVLQPLQLPRTLPPLIASIVLLLLLGVDHVG
jgi:hypothetical protein